MSSCDDECNKESKTGKGVHGTGERVGFKQVTLEWRYEGRVAASSPGICRAAGSGVAQAPGTKDAGGRMCVA